MTARRDADALMLRRATAGDADGIGDVWLASWTATFDLPPAHPDEDVRRWPRDELVPGHVTWVAADPLARDRVVALMALSDAAVEQLYVTPDWIGRGVGGRLISLAQERRRSGLELYCLETNAAGRRFYERHGFEPIAFGDGSANMERQPDVLYRWRPA